MNTVDSEKIKQNHFGKTLSCSGLNLIFKVFSSLDTPKSPIFTMRAKCAAKNVKPIQNLVALVRRYKSI